MRKAFFYLSAILLYSGICIAQNSGTQGNNSSLNMERNVGGNALTTFNSAGIQGTPYYKEEWTPGTVKFRNQTVATGLNLRFDVYNNNVYFQRDGGTFKFTEAVSEFTLGNNKDFVCRNGYPAIDKQDEKTFYEVLADGKIQLLKFRQKIVREFAEMGKPKEQRFEDLEQLYAMTKDYRMVKIKKSKGDILKALPEYTDSINKIIAASDINPRNETSLTLLFQELNKQ
jgi:hypothetical protein